MMTTTAGAMDRSAVRGTAAAFASQALRFSLNFVVAVTLARLLSPEDFGVVGIAFAVMACLEFARGGGVLVPIVQSQTLTSEQLQTLFWLNAGLGLLVTLGAFLAAPLVGHVYAEPRVVPLTGVLALSFFAGGLATQHLALLRREMRFGVLAFCEATALATASGVAILSALHGAAYWALVYFELTREVAQAALLVLATRWIPRWPERWVSIGRLVRFGGVMMVFEILGFLTFKADNLIVAWFLGPAALGFYDKAYQFLLMPVNQINTPIANVTHASLSRLLEQPERYRAYLSRALLLATSLGMPLTAFLFANADTLVGQVLGRQWLPSVPVFRALAPAAFLMSVTTCVGWIFLSLGRARRQLWWTTFAAAVTVAAFFIGVRWGVLGVAVAFSAARIGMFVPTLMYTCHGSLVDWRAILRTAARPAFASLTAMALGVAIDAMFPAGIWSLPRNAAVFGLTYSTCWIAPPGGRLLAREHLVLARTLYRNA